MHVFWKVVLHLPTKEAAAYIKCKIVLPLLLSLLKSVVRATALMAMRRQRLTCTDMHAQPVQLGKQKNKVQSIPIDGEFM